MQIYSTYINGITNIKVNFTVSFYSIKSPKLQRLRTLDPWSYFGASKQPPQYPPPFEKKKNSASLHVLPWSQTTPNMFNSSPPSKLGTMMYFMPAIEIFPSPPPPPLFNFFREVDCNQKARSNHYFLILTCK